MLSIFLSASSASAQSSPTLDLDRATIAITQLAFPHATYQFSGPNSLITGYIPDGDGVVFPTCTPCLGGDQTAVTAHFLSEKPAVVNINGQSINMYVRSDLNLTGAMLTLPNRLGVMFGIITAPATLTGSLTGYLEDPNSTPGPVEPAFFTTLNFEGTVTVFTRAYLFNDMSLLSIRQIIFHISAVHKKAPSRDDVVSKDQ